MPPESLVPFDDHESYSANLGGFSNDHFFQSKMSALVGSRVEMLESGSSFTGKVVQENTSLGKLVVLLDSGEVQNFFRRDLSSIIVLGESQESEVSSSGDLANQRENNNRDHWLDSNGNDKRTYSEIVSSQITPKQKKPSANNCSPQSEEEMKAIFESVRPEMSVLPRRLEQPETLGKVWWIIIFSTFIYMNIMCRARILCSGGASPSQLSV